MTGASEFAHAMVFTGHMIDAPGRREIRFPASAEAAARAAILRSVEAVAGAGFERTVGVAGGASGGDILFHEVCFELGVPTRLYLALPVQEYLRASVLPAGDDWVRRFHVLLDRMGVDGPCILDDSVQLPERPTHERPLNVWARTNLWMAEEVVRLAPRRSLIALWDGKGGDGPGGTAHLVEAAPALGIEVAPVIDMQTLLIRDAG